MATLPIVEHLDELENRGPCLGWTLVVGVVDELGLQRSKEALHDGVVPAVGASAHRAYDAVGIEQAPVVGRSVLAGFKGSSQHVLAGVRVAVR